MKKFPSLTKIPRHKEYSITPRYYDPVKEDIARRTERIKRDLKGGDSSTFDAESKEMSLKRKKSDFNSLLIRLSVILIGVLTLGYLYLKYLNV